MPSEKNMHVDPGPPSERYLPLSRCFVFCMSLLLFFYLTLILSTLSNSPTQLSHSQSRPSPFSSVLESGTWILKCFSQGTVCKWRVCKTSQGSLGMTPISLINMTERSSLTGYKTLRCHSFENI